MRHQKNDRYARILLQKAFSSCNNFLFRKFYALYTCIYIAINQDFKDFLLSWTGLSNTWVSRFLILLMVLLFPEVFVTLQTVYSVLLLLNLHLFFYSKWSLCSHFKSLIDVRVKTYCMYIEPENRIMSLVCLWNR